MSAIRIACCSSTMPRHAPWQRLGARSNIIPVSPSAPMSNSSRCSGPRQLRMRVWERGVGITRACGTGACAALVAAHRRGLTGRKVDVVLDGGALDDRMARERRPCADDRPRRAQLQRRGQHLGVAGQRNERVEIVTFGCRLNAYESEVIRGARGRSGPRQRRDRQHLRRDGRSGAPVAPGDPPAAARPPGRASDRHRLRRADRTRDLCRDARSRSRDRQRRKAVRRELCADFLDGRAARAGQRHHGGAGNRAAVRSTAFDEPRPRLRCRCRTAATIAAPSASSPMAAGIRAASAPARWSKRRARLVAAGFKEIVLSGVDLTAYGADLPGRPTLGTLVARILKHVPELKRLRLSSLDADRGGRCADAADRRGSSG